MKTKVEWENLQEVNLGKAFSGTSRLQVIGGWIVKHVSGLSQSNGLSIGESMVFVSDPEHKWEVEKQNENEHGSYDF